MTNSIAPISCTVYMTPEDEPPLLQFLDETGAKVIHMFSHEWPPAPRMHIPTLCWMMFATG